MLANLTAIVSTYSGGLTLSSLETIFIVKHAQCRFSKYKKVNDEKTVINKTELSTENCWWTVNSL